MNPHLRLVGVLHIAMACIGLAALLLVFGFGFAFTPGSMLQLFEDSFFGTWMVVALGFGLTCIVLALLGGWALLNGHPLGRKLLKPLAFLELINAPLGTLLGAYTLWVFYRFPSPPEWQVLNPRR